MEATWQATIRVEGEHYEGIHQENVGRGARGDERCARGATQASAASLVIDDLTKRPQLVIVTAPGANTNTVTGSPNPANVIGGSRQLDLNVGTGSNLDSIIVNTVTHRLNFNIGAGDQGFGSTYYDANGAVEAG